MSVTDLIMDGVNLMLLGMSIVFTFLILLVFTLKAMSRLARVFEPATPPLTLSPELAPDDTAANDELIAVITAAISRFRQSNN